MCFIYMFEPLKGAILGYTYFSGYKKKGYRFIYMFDTI